MGGIKNVALPSDFYGLLFFPGAVSYGLLCWSLGEKNLLQEGATSWIGGMDGERMSVLPAVACNVRWTPTPSPHTQPEELVLGEVKKRWSCAPPTLSCGGPPGLAYYYAISMGVERGKGGPWTLARIVLQV